MSREVRATLAKGVAKAASTLGWHERMEQIEAEERAKQAQEAAKKQASERQSGQNLFLRAISHKESYSVTKDHTKSKLQVVHQLPSYAALSKKGAIITVNGQKILTGGRQPDVALSWYIDGFPCMVVISNNNTETTLTGKGTLANILDNNLPAILSDTHKKITQSNVSEANINQTLEAPLIEIYQIITELNKKGSSIHPSVLVIMAYPRYLHARPSQDSPFSTFISAKGTGDIFAGIEYTDCRDGQKKCLAIRPSFRVINSLGDNHKPTITESNPNDIDFKSYTQHVPDTYTNVTLFATTGFLNLKCLQPIEPLEIEDGNWLSCRTLTKGFDPRTIVPEVLESLPKSADVETGGVCAYLDVLTPEDRKTLLFIQNNNPRNPDYFLKPTEKDKQEAVAAITQSNEANVQTHAAPPRYNAHPAAAAEAAKKPAAAAAKEHPAAPTATVTEDRAAAASAEPEIFTLAKAIIIKLKSFAPKNPQITKKEAKKQALMFFLSDSTKTIPDCTLSDSIQLTQVELVTLFDELKNTHTNTSDQFTDLKYIASKTLGSGLFSFKETHSTELQKMLAAILAQLIHTIDNKLKSGESKIYDNNFDEPDSLYKKSDVKRVLNTPIDGSILAAGKETAYKQQFNQCF